MKYRSPTNILFWGYLTLTVYDLYWLAVTARELKTSQTVKLMSSAWLVVIGILRVVTIAGVIWFGFLHFPHNKPQPISQECSYEQSVSQIPQMAGKVPFTETCKQAIADSEAASNQQVNWLIAMLVIIVAGILNLFLYSRWLAKYLYAAMIETGVDLTRNALQLITIYSEPAAVANLQQAYNDPSNLPKYSPPAHPISKAEALQAIDDSVVPQSMQPLLKRFLTVIFILLIVAIVIFAAIIFYATHA